MALVTTATTATSTTNMPPSSTTSSSTPVAVAAAAAAGTTASTSSDVRSTTMLTPSQAIRGTTASTSNSTLQQPRQRSRPRKRGGRGGGGGGQGRQEQQQQQQRPNINSNHQNSSNLVETEGSEGQQPKNQQPKKDRRAAGGSNLSNNSQNNQSGSDALTATEGQQQQNQQQADLPPTGSSSGKPKKNRKKKNKVHTNGERNPPSDQRKPNNNATANNTNAATGKAADAEAIKTKKKRNNKKMQRSHYPWRKHIPPGSVDPITLESLNSLPYPPFALVASEPYDVVEEWPASVLDSKEEDERQGAKAPFDKPVAGETEQERHERILREQWGNKLILQHQKTPPPEQETDTTNKASNSAAEASSAPSTAAPAANSDNKRRHYHLYDGRALAYYCVSQLQFIDPLNRRDLTRDELVNLDRYLRRHGFNNLNVTEAYDYKGVTISTAGAAGNTAAGRAAILQQEARVLLNALFGGRTSSSSTSAAATSTTATTPNPMSTARSTNNTNNLRSQYQAHEEMEQQLQQELYHRSQSTPAPAAATSLLLQQDLDGIFTDEAGNLVVIDDDLNPGLRSSASEFVPLHLRRQQQQPLQSHRARVQAAEFPALAETIPRNADSVATSEQQQQPPPSLPKSATLARIATSVKKTDPEEQQRQWEAREEARRKAMLSNLTLGSNMAAWEMPLAPMTPQLATTAVMATASANSMSTATPFSEAQLQRNKTLATALGVAPATLRLPQQPVLVGWARPTDPQKVKVELDEFGKELLYSTAVYPDSLILQAKERMGFLIKLERKWIKFLDDDTAPSLPLNPMDGPTRAMVHEYATGFWKMQTQSYDPEPRRYIHCSKLLDTAAPYPLLSDAARNWKGPTNHSAIITSTGATSSTTAIYQNQPLRSGREVPDAPARVPLPLKPRSGSLERQRCPPEGGVSISGAPIRSAGADTTNSRVESILSNRERPKLQLAKRSVPLELPPYQPAPQPYSFEVSEELQRRKERMEEMARKEQEMIRKQQQILEAAFASDDEDDGGGDDSGSEWEEREAQYNGSDDGE